MTYAAGPADGPEPRNVQLVTAFYDAMRRGDIGAVLELADTAIEVRQSERAPWGGRFSGREGLATFGARVRAHLRSEVVIDHYIAAGGRVAAVGRTRGAALATGSRFDAPLVHIFDIADGAIQALEVIVDMPAMEKALLPPG